MVISSYNRPLQLYALLESVEKYFINLGTVSIIYRTDEQKFEKAYCIIKDKFKNYIFYKQGVHPHEDFKPLIMHATFETPNDYIMFAVDDIIVKDYVDLAKCIDALKTTDAYGFYLRLGKHITECQTMGIKTPVPNFDKFKDDIFIYKFCNGQGDWAYPNTVDMTIYKKSEIKADLEKIPYFYNPTYFEGWWARYADLNKHGLFFETSKMVNLPLNIVTTGATNKNMNIPVNDLFDKFNTGLKIDITKLYKINNTAPHMEHIPEFIKRD